MKNIRLNVATSLFMIALCCPFAFADDGDQGSGGLSETTVVKTSQSSLDGDQGSGGFGNTSVKTSESSLDGDQGSGGRPTSTSYVDTILGYFDWLMS